MNMMKWKKMGCCLFALLAFAVNALAEDSTRKKESEALEGHVEQLDNQRSDDSVHHEGGGEPQRKDSYGPAHDTGPLPAVTDRLGFGGILAGAYQVQRLNTAFEEDNGGGGAGLIQPEISFALTEQDELFTKIEFAAGNGLNENSPFNFAPWAAPLEDDVKNINGSNRDYLLTLWYKHTFQFSEDHSLELTGGIIDATDYLDENKYANDEYTQFMNEALVNAPNAFLPSFDIGGAVDWDMGSFEIVAVYMNIHENDDGNNFNYYGAQFEYYLDTPLGEGEYRVIFSHTSEAFPDPSGQNLEPRFLMLFSFDQELGERIGAWTRFGFSDDKAAVPYTNLYSGGIDISGSLWGRPSDNMGIGYAYLHGGNQDIDRTQVAEVYVRFVFKECFGLTLDAQYMKDDFKNAEGPEGFIFGARGTIEF